MLYVYIYININIYIYQDAVYIECIHIVFKYVCMDIVDMFKYLYIYKYIYSLTDTSIARKATLEMWPHQTRHHMEIE